MVDNDDARFRQEKATNCTFVYLPGGGELRDGQVLLKESRVVLCAHRANAPVSNYRLKRCDPCFFFLKPQLYLFELFAMAGSETGTFFLNYKVSLSNPKATLQSPYI